MNTILKNALKKIPLDLRELVNKAWDNYTLAVKEQHSIIPDHNEFVPSLLKVWTSSDFAIKNSICYPDVLLDLFESGDILLEYPRGEYGKKLKLLITTVSNQDELSRLLREFRRREMLRIAWRDLAGWTKPIKTMNDLSALADACISSTNEWLYQLQREKYGTPITVETGKPLPLLILAMGKLGSNELNFSSDVDLIYCYPHDGELENGMTYHKFFLRLSQQLTKTLNEVTADGFVFRVDLRLRPYGNSGALASSFSVLTDYYKAHGRDWERYALVKARVINSEPFFTKELMHMIRKFVYRNYLDYSAIEALRKLQLVISQEVKKQGLENNIKRGAGGIREVEFISQTHKLIRGGRQFRLQERNTLKSLILLRETGCLSPEATRRLANAYKFLRNVENHLQMFNDQQTHELPNSDTNKQRIAFSMGYANWKNFKNGLNRQQTIVHRYFSALIAQPHMEFSEQINHELELNMQRFWTNDLTSSETVSLLNSVGYKDADEISRLVEMLREYKSKQDLSKVASAHLNRLLPYLFIIIGRTDNSDILLRRIIPLVEAIIEHSIYLILLLENPIVLQQSVNLCAVSPWIANQLASYPLLLDELLDPKTLFTPPTLNKLKRLLNQQLNSIPEDQIEQQLETIRWFKQAHVLRVAAADITGILPLMRVSDYLTDIASVVIDKICDINLKQLTIEHGAPVLPKKHKSAGFCIVAYGKLGGIELGYKSDLDLVFLHPSVEQTALTDGKNPITNQQFYTRLSQSIIKTLSQLHASGFLYKTDLRLRPSGSSGLIASSVEAFAEYQNSNAWCWEHQALVRARPICGDLFVANEFKKIRNDILSQPRDPLSLRDAVNSMRQKMRESKQDTTPEYFDLKQGIGGMVDIEFIAQYAVLHWGNNYPSLLEYPDNIRILERAAMENLMRVKDAHILTEAYKAYRTHIHKLSLQNEPDLVPIDEFQFFRIGVSRIWQKLFIFEES